MVHLSNLQIDEDGTVSLIAADHETAEQSSQSACESTVDPVLAVGQSYEMAEQSSQVSVWFLSTLLPKDIPYNKLM